MFERRSSAQRGAALLGLCCAFGCDPLDPPAPGDLGGVVTMPHGLPFTPLSLETGDFDGDLAVDVLVGGSPPLGGAIGAVFRGNRDGTVQPGIDAFSGTCSAYPTVGNLDGDARSDAILLGCSQNLAVLTGQPDATLDPWPVWPPNVYPYTPITGVAIGDFEGDGDSDVFVLRVWASYPSEVLVDLELSNDAHGFWATRSTRFDPSEAGFVPTQMLLGHLDDDGLLDLVLTYRDHAVARMLGTTAETFALPLELDVSVSPWLTRVGDLDRDGRDDIVVVSRTDAAVQVLLAAGDGTLVPQPPLVLPAFSPYDAAIGDFNGDGYLDVALVDDVTPEVIALRGDGAGGLGDPVSRTLPSGAIRVQAADLDGDTIDDVLAATFADDSLTFVLSTAP